MDRGWLPLSLGAARGYFGSNSAVPLFDTAGVGLSVKPAPVLWRDPYKSFDILDGSRDHGEPFDNPALHGIL